MLRAAALLLALQPAAAVAPNPGALERGREITRLVQDGDAKALAAELSPAFLAAVGGEAGLATVLRSIREQTGRELAMLEERTYREGGYLIYYRVSRHEKMPSATARWVWRPGGPIEGGTVQPSVQPAATDKLSYRTQAALRLPFGRAANGGAWQVAWGGRDPIANYHAVAPDQRFAYDFLVARDGVWWRGAGERNEDHYCWGEPLLAPAAGTVVFAVGTFPDNPKPGDMSAAAIPPGNHVVIDHGRGEHSVIAHLRQGSLAVAAGQQVAAGQKVGACGNSGRSSMPHIHYHLQNGPEGARARGLPAQFNGYEADGQPVKRGEPTRGELINPR